VDETTFLLEDKKITSKLTPDHVSLTWLSMHCLGSIKSVDFEKKLFNSCSNSSTMFCGVGELRFLISKK
jgi:hypothetical protein